MKEPRTVTLHVRVTEGVHETLKAIADAERRPLAALLALIVEDRVRSERPAIAQPRSSMWCRACLGAYPAGEHCERCRSLDTHSIDQPE